MERTIKGVVEKWKDIKQGQNKKGTFYYTFLNLYDHTEDYVFFKQEDTLKEVMRLHPNGTIVEFNQIKKGQKWEYIAGTFKAVEPEAKPIKPIIKRPATDSEKIIRQNALRHSLSYISVLSNNGVVYDEVKDVKKEIFKFAEEIEQWVHRDV